MNLLLNKRALLLPYFRVFADEPILDFGCGDLDAVQHLPARHYRGLDSSESALTVARSRRPDWDFGSAELEALPDSSVSLAVCAEALLESSMQQRQGIAQELIRVAAKAVIVAGAAQPFTTEALDGQPETFEHTLRSQPNVHEVTRIGGCPGIDVFLVTKTPAVLANANDIGVANLAAGTLLTPNWRLLNELVSLSREELGFFPNTIIRANEYPWFASNLERHVGESVLDVGAGVSVLPLWLAGIGCAVTTVDLHSTVRTRQTRAAWNEWGFLDYSALDPTIESFNTDASTFGSSRTYGAVYSVSVLEHAPAAIRRAIFANIADLLASSGRVYLSFDLVPGSRDLWPYSEGKMVEPPEVHGTIDDILAELASTGFVVEEFDTVAGIPDSRTDLAFVIAQLA